MDWWIHTLGAWGSGLPETSRDGSVCLGFGLAVALVGIALYRWGRAWSSARREAAPHATRAVQPAPSTRLT